MALKKQLPLLFVNGAIIKLLVQLCGARLMYWSYNVHCILATKGGNIVYYTTHNSN